MSEKKDIDIEIVHSNDALSLVSKWLGISPDEVQDSSVISEADLKPRTQYAGLGAKYVPHSQATTTANLLESKLEKRLKRGLKQIEKEDAEEAENVKNPPLLNGEKNNTAQNKRDKEKNDIKNIDESDDEGRERSIKKKKSFDYKEQQQLLFSKPDTKAKRKKFRQS
mmetsp:Transcript_7356/g.14490  ORF Transcript_7356/g.14490 Transcript_7356/m.14490 type:complete len:167 (-) Transcript_7356:19-519(-)